MNDGLVLHVATPSGGGIDRHVRDLARGSVLAHGLWHVTARADAVEAPCGGTVWPLSRGALDANDRDLRSWVRTLGAGAVHAHSMDASARERAEWLSQVLGRPMIATLHDVLFFDPRGFDASADVAADARWVEDVHAFLRRCAAVLAPSRFIAEAARHHMGDLDVEVIPNGIDDTSLGSSMLAAPPAFQERAPRQVVAVMGAIGPHKGSELVEALATELEGSGIALVLIGYLDTQVKPGWRGGNLYIHGPFDVADAAAWLHAYGVRVVVFPNRVPESFSYALSEAWAARCPVVVPDEGALGARVREHGGGWLVPPRSDAATFAALLRRLLSPAHEAEMAQVQSRLATDDPARIPRLADMTRSLDALYRRFGLEPGTAIDAGTAPAQALLAANLDASLFRAELARLADERVQLEEGMARERAQAEEYERESRAWIAKVEADLAQLKAQLTAEFDQRRAVEDARFKLQQEVAHLQGALARLPGFVQRYLLRRTSDGRA